MSINRRRFLVVASVGAVTVLTGCSSTQSNPTQTVTVTAPPGASAVGTNTEPFLDDIPPSTDPAPVMDDVAKAAAEATASRFFTAFFRKGLPQANWQAGLAGMATQNCFSSISSTRVDTIPAYTVGSITKRDFETSVYLSRITVAMTGTDGKPVTPWFVLMTRAGTTDDQWLVDSYGSDTQ